MLKKEKILPHHGKYFAGATEAGKKRENNEDSFSISDNGIFIVADGVGGAQYGQEASRFLVEHCRNPDYMAQDIGRVSKHINRYSESKDLRIATTVVSAVQSLENENAYKVFNVGDSPAYLVDTNNRSVKEITPRDEHMRENSDGENKLVLSHSVGGEMNPPIHQKKIILKPGQSILLVTDGISDYVDNGSIPPGQIIEALMNGPSTAVDKLIQLANSAGGKDNITAVVINYQT